MTRLWHYKLIPVLPRLWLISQLRECAGVCAMYKTETINHATINRVKDYDFNELKLYSQLVVDEMLKRGYKVGYNALEKMDLVKYNYNLFDEEFLKSEGLPTKLIDLEVLENITFTKKLKEIKENRGVIFENYHNDRYLKQCYYMFEEKLDCGMLTENEFIPISKLCTKILN